MFLDDDFYADIYDIEHVEQRAALGIESIFMLFGRSDLALRHDPISWNRLLEMVIHYREKISGQITGTRLMTIISPWDYDDKVTRLIETRWNHKQ